MNNFTFDDDKNLELKFEKTNNYEIDYEIDAFLIEAGFVKKSETHGRPPEFSRIQLRRNATRGRGDVTLSMSYNCVNDDACYRCHRTAGK